MRLLGFLVELTEKHKQQIEIIIADMKSKNINCLKDYECYKSGIEKLCKAIKISTLIECLSEEACVCGLSLSFSKSALCECPLRRYILQNFNR